MPSCLAFIRFPRLQRRTHGWCWSLCCRPPDGAGSIGNMAAWTQQPIRARQHCGANGLRHGRRRFDHLQYQDRKPCRNDPCQALLQPIHQLISRASGPSQASILPSARRLRRATSSQAAHGHHGRRDCCSPHSTHDSSQPCSDLYRWQFLLARRWTHQNSWRSPNRPDCS